MYLIANIVSLFARGLIDQFESVNIDAKRACEMVAEELVKKGLFEDAIKLFDLAGVSVLSLSVLSPQEPS